jgi:molybdopterin converting factor small subunit
VHRRFEEGAGATLKVRAEFYSHLREIVGDSSLEITLNDGATVGNLAEELSREYPRLRDFEKSMLFGIGVEFVERDHLLNNGEVIAIMPPVQGG